ncbi:hypothetical protein B0H19DRAFT_1251457 [Mycena capillaripes]|nr:hypothetical protein B0H19DRAFT_1251457 [Mycena capillaripes]
MFDRFLSRRKKARTESVSHVQIKQEDEEPRFDDGRRLPIIQEGRQILPQLESYPNSFLKQEDTFRLRGVVIITGVPGIGKTSFLKAIFQLRANANLLTIFIQSAQSGIVYKNGKAGRLNGLLRTNLYPNLPRSTWVLVDSNSNLKTIPGEVLETDFFIIHAVSPRERLVTKCDDRAGAQLCVMEPWSLGTYRWSFTTDFGGSAHDAYVHALDQRNFEVYINALDFPADTIRSSASTASLQRWPSPIPSGT